MNHIKMKQFFNLVIFSLSLSLMASTVFAEEIKNDDGLPHIEDGASYDTAQTMHFTREFAYRLPYVTQTTVGKGDRVRPSCDSSLELIKQRLANKISSRPHHFKFKHGIMDPKSTFDSLLDSSNEARYNGGELDISNLISETKNEYKFQVNADDYPKLTSPLELARFTFQHKCTVK